MTSLVPYASSDEEDTADVEEHRDGVQLRRARLSAFGERSGETEEGGARVHTSLGVAASRPLKGDWLSYAYVPIDEGQGLCAVLQQACTLIAMHCSDVHVVQEPHISLTKPLLVRSHERTLLLTKASEAVWQLGVPRFPVAFSAFAHLPSEDHTRTFWAVEVGLGWQELHALTSALNENLAALHAREYFQEARFHASLAWTPAQALSTDQLNDLFGALEGQLGQQLRACAPLLVDKIGVATGLERHLVDLQRASNAVASPSRLRYK